MKWIARGAAVAAVAAGVAVVRRARSSDGRSHWPTRPRREPAQRWHIITVNRPPEQVAPEGRLPEPLARLADAIEVRIRPAPTDRGTELAARLHYGEPYGLGALTGARRGRDAWYAVRSALREAKQLVETGEVLRPHQPPTARRTVRNWPLRFAARHGREGGRL